MNPLMTSKSTMPRRFSILIVEDNTTTAELMKAQLQGGNYSIDSVLDGEAALLHISKSKPDLILLDIIIPKRSGFEVCKEIKARPETSGIPVIMVTALQDMESRVKGIAAGADDFLSRPVDKSELIARVKSMLRIKQLRDDLIKESEGASESNKKLEMQQRVLKSMSAQLMQASHLKYEFIVNMSHSLRTPLNVIIGFSEMLQDELIGALNEKQTKYVGNIRTSGHELQGLITNIVDVFKIDTGKVPLETTEFSLENAIDTAVAAFEGAIRKKNIQVSIKVAPEVSRICADPQKLATTLGNLLSNAFKFMPEGGEVNLTADRYEDGTRICVADSGPGLSPEDCKRIFSEFYKVSDPLAPSQPGSGLGLSIARKLILMHGGDIWAESEEGTGAKFIFTIPDRQEEPQQ